MPAAGLLLDTHVFLWWRVDSPRLSAEARGAIAAAGEVHVSAASAWEAAIKISLGRLKLPERFESGVAASGFSRLMVTFEHAEEVALLPLHHRDPFDRLLVAQARVEGLTLVSGDPQLAAYEVDLLSI